MTKKRRQLMFAAIILLVAVIFGVSIGALTWIIRSTPDITTYKGSSETTLIYSADGQLLTKLYQKNRVYVSLDRIPKELQNAIIAIEDNDFYVHHGIDFWGIARALITNIVKMRDRPHGASTITQQLAGNVLLDRQERTYYRKIQEAYLALQFERLYTKPEILEMYLNEIFLGDINHNSYGIESAAQLYFNKHVWELDLGESAMLAGMFKGSHYYSPFLHYDRSIQRRDLVLKRMLELGYIEQDEYQQAKKKKLVINPSTTREEEVAPYFIRYIRDQLIERFGAQVVYGGGLKVYTTLDPQIQQAAEAAVKNALAAGYIPTVEKDNSADPLQPQMAIITIDPSNGAIRAMIGGRGNDQFNRAVQAIRQPGSTFKPFVYTTAIKKGYSPAHIINDMPMLAKKEKDQPLTIWPKNTKDEYRGYVTLRTAVNQSINVVAVKLLQEVGIKDMIKTTEEMGITTLQPVDRHGNHLALALGGLNKGVTPLEMASAYGILANKGIRVEPMAITKVLDKRDRVIYRAHPRKEIILSEDVAYIMTNMLQTAVRSGTGWRAKLGTRDVAGKTGTSNDYTDAWFVGYTPDLVTSVWIGEDNLASMEYNQKDEQGQYLFPEGDRGRTVSSGEATRLWGEYMRAVVKNRPASKFDIPANIVGGIKIDPTTGLLPNQYTPITRTEIFRRENIPTEIGTLHQPTITVEIDRESGLLATANCPQENIVEYSYFAESGIRVGPARIEFAQEAPEEVTAENENEEIPERVEGVYVVEKGEPVQQIDPETGVPLTGHTGQVLYEQIPDRECDLHQPSVDNLIDEIWNFFNFNKDN